MHLRSYFLSLSSYFSALAARLNNRSLPLIPKLSRLQKSLFVISCIFIFTLITVHGSQFTKQTVAAEKSEIRYQRDARNAGGAMEPYNGSFMNATAYSLHTSFTDIQSIPDEVLSAIENHQPIATGAWIPGGVAGNLSSMIATLNYPQASGIEYIASIKNSFLGKPAYAQGVGFAGLQPLLPLWRGFRNIVYILSSIIFIAIGMMIILRVKISPQAVVTIQNAIPGLITTLILVTFSYAIAGLAIDFIYLLAGLVIAMFYSITGTAFGGNLLNPWSKITNNIWPLSWLGNAAQIAYQQFTGTSPYTLEHLTNPSFNTYQSLVYHAMPSWSLYALSGMVSSVVLGTLGGGIFNLIAGGVGNDLARISFGTAGGLLGGTIGGVIISLIMTIIMTFWLIKLFFGLIKAYVTIIFKIIIAPLEIAMGAFPGSKMGFSSWINDLIGYIAIFPITTIFLVLLNLIGETILSDAGKSLWIPGQLLIGAAGSNWWSANAIVKAALGLAGLGLVSKMPEMIPQFIFSLKPSPWSQGMDQSYKSVPTSLLNAYSVVSHGADSARKIDTAVGHFRTPAPAPVAVGGAPVAPVAPPPAAMPAAPAGVPAPPPGP